MIVTDPYQPAPEKHPGGAVFGNAVRERRLAAGLTLRACAELVGISMSDLSAVEQGQRAFSVQEWF
ncbi:MAG: helix-turn-helix transcriptional regulator, partial [Phycisphaerae bacterium]|nr:helix-turn-helix transcriptional regulator [Phycisphaerae bacterium]